MGSTTFLCKHRGWIDKKDRAFWSILDVDDVLSNFGKRDHHLCVGTYWKDSLLHRTCSPRRYFSINLGGSAFLFLLLPHVKTK